MEAEWLPFYINPRGLKTVVFGGGGVASRRARMLAEAGARVRVYALDFTPELTELAEKGLVEIERVDLRAANIGELIGDAVIVVIAVSDKGLAERIAGEALKRGILVNNAVEARKGNMIVPYRGRTSYGLHIAATSLGETGVGARRALERILQVLERDPYYRTLYRAMARLKRYLKENVADPRARFKANLAADADPEVHRLAGEGDEEGAYNRALAVAMESIKDPRDPGGD